VSIDLDQVKELIRLLDETDIAELSLESDGVRIQIRKGTAFTSAGGPGAGPNAAELPEGRGEEQPSPPRRRTEPAVSTPPAETQERRVQITAPMVGTFYRAPAPDADPYVEVGDEVTVGQPLCIIEAMKLMNEIESEVEGVLVEILAQNGQPVEYGQPLFVVEQT